MDDYEKVDFEGLKLKIQSVHVPEGGFLLMTLPRYDTTYMEVKKLQEAMEQMSGKVSGIEFVLVWRDFDVKEITREELEEIKWRIEELLKNG